jgi:hypothetical protein
MVFPVDDLRAAIHYVRLKPGTSCRIAVFQWDVGSATGPPLGFLLYLYPDAARACAAYEKIAGRPRFPTETSYRHFMDKLAVVAVPFPDDTEIPGLRHFYRNSRLRRALYDVLPGCPESEWNIKKNALGRRLLAYKPGRRAVYRVDVRLESRAGAPRRELSLHVRVESPSSYRTGLDILASVGAAIPSDAGWFVPGTYGAVQERWLTAREWVDGVGLDTCLTDDGPFESAGAALASLHGTTIDLGRARTRFGPAEIARLALDLTELVPVDNRRIRTLAVGLVERAGFLSDPCASLVHGDFHLGQMILTDNGLAMVDLDRAGSGHPLCDVGSFLAHLEELRAPEDRAAAFLKGYASASGSYPDPEELRVATAVALFRRSVFPFRGLSPAWPDQIRNCLDRVDDLLGGGS